MKSPVPSPRHPRAGRTPVAGGFHNRQGISVLRRVVRWGSLAALAAPLALAALLAIPADGARTDDWHLGGSYPPHQAAGAGGDLALIYVSGSSSEELPPLHEAVRLGHVSVVSELLAAGADANEKSGRGSTPLHWAVDAPVVSLLLAAGAGVNATTAAGSTPLHSAAEHGRTTIVATLLAAGAEVNAKDNAGRTPLQATTQRTRVAHASVVSLLLAAGAEVNAKDNAGQTPLHRVANVSVVSLLLAAGAEVNVKDNAGRTPLHRVAHASVVSLLLAAGAEVNAKDNAGRTPLHWAEPLHWSEPFWERGEGNYATIVAMLIASGAEVNAKNNDGNTPLHQAAALSGHASVVSMLLAAGAEVNAKNNDGDSPLYSAALDISVLSVLLAAGAEAERQRYADPSISLAGYRLHLAVNQGHASVVSVLLAAGAAYVDEESLLYGPGPTPLIRAAFSGHASVVSVLLAAGADVNAIADNAATWAPYDPYVPGSTPLHWAAYNGHASVASLLLAAGAYANATNNDGETPLDIAKQRKKWGVVALLERLVRAAPQKSRAEIGSAESVFENTWRSVVVVVSGDTQGGGVVVNGPNQVATNCHVVDESPNDIRVYKGAERRAVRDAPYSAEIVAGDRERDVCLLSVPGLWGIAAGVRRAGDLAVGEAVYAVGAPQGFDFSISDGIVSQLRTLAGERAPLIQTSAAISPGSSGGGLFDSEGRLVGLTTWKIREGENLNFAVPVDWALELQ